ncbi:hypothetical protein D918_06518 [Trichuris suis]|nr:hypothetical protein D918_06518 [Trichuris suis]
MRSEIDVYAVNKVTLEPIQPLMLFRRLEAIFPLIQNDLQHLRLLSVETDVMPTPWESGSPSTSPLATGQVLYLLKSNGLEAHAMKKFLAHRLVTMPHYQFATLNYGNDFNTLAFRSTVIQLDTADKRNPEETVKVMSSELLLDITTQDTIEDPPFIDDTSHTVTGSLIKRSHNVQRKLVPPKRLPEPKKRTAET